MPHYNMVGFFGVGARSVSTTYPAAVQDVIMESIIKAKEIGYRQILILSDCKRIEQVCNRRSQQRWLEQTMM